MERREIFCPECKKKGKYKKLMEVEESACGVILPYCKVCKKNVRVDLDNVRQQWRNTEKLMNK
ncbi:MAG: hypothetical protein RSD17_02755 [Oscillospiraceae bacterium]